MRRLNPKLTEYSRQLRTNLTTPELRLWYRIRNKQLKTLRFLNSDVMKNIDGVIETIQQNIKP